MIDVIHREQWEIDGSGRMTDAQRRMLNAVCGDLSAQVEWHGNHLSKDDWRHMLSGTMLGWRMMPAIDRGRGAAGFIMLGGSSLSMSRTMAKDAIVFAMANPTPEIMPDLAKQAGVRVIGTGRSDFPNQVNNVLAFPGIFKGALSVRARDINPAMKMAAAKAIAGLIPDDELNEENILPKAFDPRVADAVAAAVAQAARESGVARV